jgi:hypothetical protein
MRFARVQVERVYRGLPPDTAQVLVNTDPSDPCGETYMAGQEYLFFAALGPTHRAVPVLHTGQCSGSRLVSVAPDDLGFLELYRAGGARTRVFGKTLQFVFRNHALPEIPAARATVTLRSGSLLRQQLSGVDGSYSFEDVPPGDYELLSTLPHFVQTPQYRSITIVPGGCAHRLLELKPETRLSGFAVHGDGTPAAGVEVQLLRRTLEGEWANDAAHTRTTDSAGQFVFENVPATEYLVGIDLERNAPDAPASPTVQLLPGIPIDGLRLPLPVQGPPL